jgi:hypothetical protein
MKEAVAISWNIIDKKVFTFYFNSSTISPLVIGTSRTVGSA